MLRRELSPRPTPNSTSASSGAAKRWRSFWMNRPLSATSRRSTIIRAVCGKGWGVKLSPSLTAPIYRSEKRLVKIHCSVRSASGLACDARLCNPAAMNRGRRLLAGPEELLQPEAVGLRRAVAELQQQSVAACAQPPVRRIPVENVLVVAEAESASTGCAGRGIVQNKALLPGHRNRAVSGRRRLV